MIHSTSLHITDCFLSIISPQRYQTGYYHLKQNWELAFWSLDTISSFGSLLISVPSPCNHTLKVASSRPPVYREQFKIAFISVHQNHMLITWLITTLNCQPLLLTLSPFASCLREKGDAAWIIHTVGMLGPEPVSHTASLIPYSLTCLLYSWKNALFLWWSWYYVLWLHLLELLCAFCALQFVLMTGFQNVWLHYLHLCMMYYLHIYALSMNSNTPWAGHLHFILHSACTANRFSLCLHPDCSLTFV